MTSVSCQTELTCYDAEVQEPDVYTEPPDDHSYFKQAEESTEEKVSKLELYVTIVGCFPRFNQQDLLYSVITLNGVKNHVETIQSFHHPKLGNSEIH